MAIINTIRKRTGLLLIIILLGIVAFLLQDLFTSGRLFSGGPKPVGEIAGVDISLQDYQTVLSEMEAQYEMATGQPLDEQTRPRVRQQAWDQLVFEHAYGAQYAKLGIMVTNEGPDCEQVDMVRGLTVHSQMTQEETFLDPVTGQFSPERVVQFLSQIADPQTPEAEYYQKIWFQREKAMVQERLRTKYFDLYSKTAYVTELEAKREHREAGSSAVIDYFYLPFTAIEDSMIAVSEDELSDYLAAHPNEFEAYPNRSVEYVVFNVLPSAADREAFMISFKALAGRFAETANDTTFVNSYAENPQIRGYTKELLPPALKADSLEGPQIGKVYGPFEEGPGQFKLYKAIAEVRDTVRTASHILLKDPAKADSVLTALKQGADFEALAKEISEDPGSGAKGGDLGEFRAGQMVPEFQGAVFSAKRAGLIDSLVQSQFGFHIIKVGAAGGVLRTEPQIVVASVDKTLRASERSRNEVYRKASIFQNRSENLDGFRVQAEGDSSVELQTAPFIDANSPYLGQVPNAREAVMWAYNDESEIGDLSPVIKLENQYVILALTGKRDKDEKTVEGLRDQLEAKVRRDKKREILLSQAKSVQAPKGDMKALADAYNTKYNPFATFGKDYQLTMQVMGLSESGYEPAFVGQVFRTEKGQASGFIGGESGVLAFVVRRRTEPTEIADYSTVRQGLLQQIGYQMTQQVDNWVREHAEVDDRRYRYY